MKSKGRNQLKVIMLFCVTLLMSNCQNEENSLNQSQSKIQTVAVDEAKNFLLYSKTNSSAKSANNELENLELSKITQEKINGSNQLLTVIPFAASSNLENKRILLLKIDNEIESVVFSMYADENSVKGSFSGELFAYSLAGDFINGFRAKDGIIVSRFVETNIDNGKTSKSTGRAIQLKEVVVRGKTVHALDMFGSTGGMYGDGLFGGGIGNSGGGGYSWDTGGGISAPTSEEIAIALERQIDDSKLDPCPKAVLEKLKNATNCDIANLFTKLGANRTISVIIKTELPTDGKPAQTLRTNPQARYNYTVRISSDYTSATTLFRASNILHEFAHAYFMSLIDDYNSTGNPVVFADTPTLFQAYCDRNYPPKGNELQNLHHKEMAKTYVTAIGAALQEFQTGVPVAVGETPNQIYTDLAWGGLKGTSIYNETFPVGSEDYNRIEGRYGAESNGGTSGNQIAIGKPCKI